jgi:hypothetical protein
MNKNLMAVILFPVVINGCISDPFESDREVDIITNNSVYLLTDELKIKVNFKNYLSRDIRILNSGCSFPSFILEKKVENNWQEVYSPICPEIPVEPTILESGKIFTAEIRIHTPDIQSDNPQGEYRLSFDLIEKNSNNRLPEKFAYSNEFRMEDDL